MLVNKVFVYGSLRSGMFNYDKFLKGKVKSVENGTIFGELFNMENKGYPAVIYGTEEVSGELMELKDSDKILVELDELENFKKLDNNSEYLREVIEVFLEDGTREKAYFYKYNPKSILNKNDELRKVNSGDWLNK